MAKLHGFKLGFKRGAPQQALCGKWFAAAEANRQNTAACDYIIRTSRWPKDHCLPCLRISKRIYQ